MGKGNRIKNARIENSHIPTMEDVAKVYEVYKQSMYSLLLTDNIADILTLTEDTAEDVFGFTPDGHDIYKEAAKGGDLDTLIGLYKHDALAVLLLGMALQVSHGGQYGGDVTDEVATLAAHKLMQPLIDDILARLESHESDENQDEQ